MKLKVKLVISSSEKIKQSFLITDEDCCCEVCGTGLSFAEAAQNFIQEYNMWYDKKIDGIEVVAPVVFQNVEERFKKDGERESDAE